MFLFKNKIREGVRKEFQKVLSRKESEVKKNEEKAGPVFV